MTKSEFKKKLRKENPALKKYYIYEAILALLLLVTVVPNLILMLQNLLPTNLVIINALLVILMALPLVIIDTKNDAEIKKLYQAHVEKEKAPEYQDKTKMLGFALVFSIVIIIINACITIPNIKQGEDLGKIEDTLTITTDGGDEIETQYEEFDGFKLKIPKDFKIMSDEAISVKYPNGNPPSLVYTNADTTINVALVLNDMALRNDQVEEYTKTAESAYREYAEDVKASFWERSGHKIGEIEFIAQGSDTEIYNHLIAFSVNDTVRLVNFNCTKAQMAEWQKVSDFIVDSVVFE